MAVSAPVLFVPLLASAPLQPPDAVQAVAFVELHVSVEVVPLARLVGEAANVAVGTGFAAVDTVTVAVAAVLLPPGPVQTNEYVVFAVRAPVLWVPLAANAPLHPPDAVQAVAFVELHVNVEADPLAILVGAAANVAVGVGELAGVTSTVTDLRAVVPPVPVHSSEYVVFCVSAPVLCVPLLASVPDQPPEAVHDVAFAELQVNVVELPLLRLVDVALIETVGASVIPGAPPPPPPQAARRNATTIMNKECFIESLILLSVE